MNKLRTFPSRSRQAGFTLVEMMVAVTIGLVVLFGMTATFVNLKTTFKSQDSLGQLQDNERVALTFLTTAVNEAGYYPNPLSGSTLAGSDPAGGGWPGAMPATGMFGVAAVTGKSEALETAYASVNGDGLISCIGTNYTGTSVATVRNVFYVDTTTNALMCKVYVNGLTSDTAANGGTPATLISGVSGMSVQYGLTTTGDAQVSTYKLASALGSSDWANVKAVRITLNFVNPFNSAATIQRTHTINVMN